MAARLARTQAGMRRLNLWLRDVVRTGLAAVPEQPAKSWRSMAATLFDHHAAAAARDISALVGIHKTGADWPQRLLTRLSRLFLLTEGWARYAEVSAETQSDLRTAAGWYEKPSTDPHAPIFHDRWLVLGSVEQRQQQLTVRRTWLQGLRDGRLCLLLDLKRGRKGKLPARAVVGSVLEAQVQFALSASPMRGEIISEPILIEDDAVAARFFGLDGLRDGLAAYGAALGRNPWLLDYGLLFSAVTIDGHDDKWRLLGERTLSGDKRVETIPIIQKFKYGRHLLAMSGGRPFTLFGEWEGRFYRPLSVFFGGRWVDLSRLASG